MAIKPKIVTVTNSSVEVLNAIRNSASTDYKNYVPVATENADIIREIGVTIMNFPNLQNEFVNALINRIGRVLVTSKLYDNPWQMFKSGILEMGETVEEVFVDLAKPFTYDPAVAENTVWKREIPNVKSAFHILNYQKFYKDTIQRDDLKKAFLTMDGVIDLINKIVDSMYTAAAYDEFQVMKFLLAERILAGQITPIDLGDFSNDDKGLATAIKQTSNKMTFMSPNYNLVGVKNFALKDNQYLIINANADASMDVNVLATAFNMDKASFMGHRVLVDGFGDIDVDRLDELFDGDDTYNSLSDEYLTALNAIPAVIVDGDFFKVFDTLLEFDSIWNPEGRYWNYFYHAWKIFSVSPFANCAMFVPETPAVTSVTVSPATANTFGGGIQFQASVATTNFAPKSVKWTVTDADGDPTDDVVIDASGNFKIVADVEDIEDNTQYIVTATSIFDSTATDTATVTVNPAEEDEALGG